MSFNIKNSDNTDWVTPSAGSVKVKANGVWNTAVKVYVKQGGVWVDSGYIGYPNAATSFAGSGGNGDNKTVTFTWTPPTTGAAATGYTLKVYTSSTATTPTWTKSISGGSTATTTYTFAAANTDYWVKLYTVGAAGESLSGATNSSGGTKLKVHTGNASYTSSDWGAAQTFTPGWWSQSTWPGEPYGDNTYRGDKAFDGDGNTYWTGQSWAWPGGNDWISFYMSGLPAAKVLINSLVNWSPAGFNWASSVSLDRFNYPNWDWTGTGWDGSSTFYGGQVITCNFEIPAGTTYGYRLYYTDLGYNPTAYGNYRVATATIAGTYQAWVTTTVPATANTVTNA